MSHTILSKWRRLLCLCMALVLLSLLLTACGDSKLSGTYYSADGISQTFTFKGDTVTMSAFGINATGTYTIDGDRITISYSLFGIAYDWQQSFSKSGDSIYIGGTQFIKE